MAYSLIWLADVLRKAGLNVEEIEGWKTRGHGNMAEVRGVMLHHTAGGKKGNAPSLDICIKGRPDLKGPLCHLVLARDGTYFVIAAGKASHAGKGAYAPLKLKNSGNAHMIGIEAENTGLTSGDNAEAWGEPIMNAYRLGVSAMLQHLKLDASHAIGHKEYTSRKIDPSFDMKKFRSDITKIMAGAVPQ
jgi:hypothetical protein